MTIDQLFNQYGDYILSLKNTKTLKALEITIPKHWVVNIITEPFTLKLVEEGHYFLIVPKGIENPEVSFQSLINKLVSLVEFNKTLEKKQNEFQEMVKNIENKFQSEIDNLINMYSGLEDNKEIEQDDELESEELESDNLINENEK
mgnify:CR=1 FL=1